MSSMDELYGTGASTGPSPLSPMPSGGGALSELYGGAPTINAASMAGHGGTQGMPATIAALEASIAAGHRGSGLGGFLGNFGHDFMGFATGLPSMLQLGAGNIAGAGADIYGHFLPFAPGAHGAIGYAAGVGAQDRAAISGLLHGYQKSYGPALSALGSGHPLGAVQDLGSQAYQHPFNTGLDALTVVAGLGALGKVGEVAGAMGKAGLSADPSVVDAGRVAAMKSAFDKTRYLQQSIDPAGKVFGSDAAPTVGRRVRNAGQFVKAEGRQTSSIPFGQSPYSPNPLVRELAQKPLARAMGHISSNASGYDAAGMNYLPQSQVANKAAASLGREYAGKIGASANLQMKMTPEARAYRDAVKALKGDPLKPGSTMTAELQKISHDLHMVGYDTPQKLQALFTHDSAAIAIAKAAGEKVVDRQAQLDKLGQILNDPKLHSPDPASRLGKSIQAGRNLAPIEKQAYQDAYKMSDKAMTDRALLPQTKVLGDPLAAYPMRITPADSLAVFKNSPIEATSGTNPGVFLRNAKRLFGSKQYKNTGALIEHANVDYGNPLQLLSQLHQSFKMAGGNDSISQFVAAASWRDANSLLPISGKLDEIMRQFSPGEAHPVSINIMKQELAKLEKDPSPSIESTQTLRDLLSGAMNTAGVDPNEMYMAINAHAANEFIRTLTPTGGKFGHGWDVSQRLWKDAVLALSPRWYVHVTAGHAIQYAIGAGPRDWYTILQTIKMPADLRLVIEKHFSDIATGLTMGGSGIDMSKIAALYHFNDQIQFRIRSAMLLAMGKKVMRGEGWNARLSAKEMATALEKIATDPQYAFMKTEILDQALTFVGDYLNFSPFEKNVLKRIFPFYSWLRVIGKLTLSLPLHHPLMANAIATLGRAAEPVVDPLDPGLPVYRRGAVNLPGFSVASSGFNPFGTVGDIAAGLGTPGLNPAVGVAGALAQGAESPLVQFGLDQLTGQNQFTGGQFSAPPGYGGGAAPFGQTPEAINPVTGLPNPVSPRPGVLQDLFSNMVPQESIIRGALTAGAPGPTYDTTGDLTLLLNRLGLEHTPPEQMFMPPSKTGGSGVVTPSLGPGISYLTGGSTFQTNQQQMIKSEMARLQAMLKGQNANKRQLAKNAYRLSQSKGKAILP